MPCAPRPGGADPELARFLLFDAAATAIRKAAADRPLLLVMDDLHWAGPASRRLLAAIRGVFATLPVVALCTYRDTEPGADALCAEVGPERHLVLGGLAPGELAAAVRMATGSAVPDALIAGLHARTAGTPTFAAERSGGLAPRAVCTPRISCQPKCRRARCGPCWSGDWPGRRPDHRAAAGGGAAGDELYPPLLAEIAGSPWRRWRPRWRWPGGSVTSRDRSAHPPAGRCCTPSSGPSIGRRWHARIGALLAGRYRAGAVGPAPAAWHLLAAAEVGGEAGPALEFARLAAADAARWLGLPGRGAAVVGRAGPGRSRWRPR